MTPAEVAATLRQFNGWRRDFDDKFEQPDPQEVSEAIDAAVEMIDRLEAAEKELAELRSSMKFRTSLIGRTEAERDALRAKIEAMEKPESGFRERRTPAAPAGGSNRFPLYALPGAKGEKDV